ncbi:hypothetical protein BC941DRAFT_509062 [Chlamydoabsidia padenii]|nr:hypothetical protein BC941DRAFT_509062 [Chlamydoabsidia padenii]
MNTTFLRQVVKSQASLLRQTQRPALTFHGVRLTLSFYSTQLPKKAAGAFTSNRHITPPSTTGNDDPNNSNVINKTLVYIGPFSETIKRYKMTASLFGICGICAVPALLSTGQAPALSVALAGVSAVAPSIFIHWYTQDYVANLIAYEDIKTIERQRKQQRTLPPKDMWLGIESWTFFGRKKEHNMWLSQLVDISDQKAMRWQWGKKKFTLERGIMDADPFLKRLASSVHKANKV